MEKYTVNILGCQKHIKGTTYENRTVEQVNAIIEKYWDTDLPRPIIDTEAVQELSGDFNIEILADVWQIECRETGDIIEWNLSYSDAVAQVEKYEENDKEEDNYTPDYYLITRKELGYYITVISVEGVEYVGAFDRLSKLPDYGIIFTPDEVGEELQRIAGMYPNCKVIAEKTY